MQIWAHRGASGEFPENTLLAFEQAILQGADGIELDVFQVEDELYIWHDRYICDTAGQEHLLTNQSKDWVRGIKLPQAQHVPTLTEALKSINGRCAVNVEVKQLEKPERLVQALNRAVDEMAFTRQQFVISSFDHDFLKDWRLTESFIKPFIKQGMLSASTLCYVNIPDGLYSIHLCIDCLRKADVQRAHELGYKALVYTVDRPSDIQLCLELGVDGIFTNFPARSRQFLEAVCS